MKLIGPWPTLILAGSTSLVLTYTRRSLPEEEEHLPSLQGPTTTSTRQVDLVIWYYFVKLELSSLSQCQCR